MGTTTKGRWSNLKDYGNPWGVWAKHPDRPVLITPIGETSEGKWQLWSPRETENASKPREDRKLRTYSTFPQAVAGGGRLFGIKGWRYVTVNRMGVWLPDNDSTQAEAGACEKTMSDAWSFTTCGRPAVGDGLCKLHLSVKTRRDDRHEKWKAEWDAADVRHKEESKQRQRSSENERAAQDYVDRLAGYGVKAAVAFDKKSFCHAAVGVQGETVVRMVEEIEMLRRELGLPGLEEEPIR